MRTITQYPENDDNGNPMNQKVEALAKKEGFLDKWFRKIGKFFNLSRTGKGHSESMIEVLPITRSLWLPEEVKFEGHWWDRTVTHDGGRRYGDLRDAEALESATQYSNLVCLGNMRIFRNFLETSIARSDTPHKYVTALAERALNKKGRDLLMKRVKELFSCKLSNLFTRVSKERKASATSLIIGFTRKHELWLPQWSDEDKLWQKTVSNQ